MSARSSACRSVSQHLSMSNSQGQSDARNEASAGKQTVCMLGRCAVAHSGKEERPSTLRD